MMIPCWRSWQELTVITSMYTYHCTSSKEDTSRPVSPLLSDGLLSKKLRAQILEMSSDSRITGAWCNSECYSRDRQHALPREWVTEGPTFTFTNSSNSWFLLSRSIFRFVSSAAEVRSHGPDYRSLPNAVVHLSGFGHGLILGWREFMAFWHQSVE